MWISGALTAAQLTAAAAADATLTGLSVTAGKITIGGEQIDVRNYAGQTYYAVPKTMVEEHDETSVDAGAKMSGANIPAFEVEMSFFDDDDANGVKGLLYNNHGQSVHVLRIEYPAPSTSVWTGVVRFFGSEPEQQNAGEAGVRVRTTTARNAGASPPVWE